MARSPRSILMAVVLWIVILGGVASVVRFMILPRHQDKIRDALLNQTGSDGLYKHDIIVAADSFSGYAIFRSEAFRDRLSREEIRLTVKDDGANYTERMKMLADGEVQMALFPINSFIQVGSSLGDFPATIVYLVDETVGADAIVANKTLVPDISGLNRSDARIVATPDSPSEFLARILIASFQVPDLPRDKWMVASDGAGDAYKRLKKTRSDDPVAYALWEPYVSNALQDQDVHILIDSSKLKGYIVDALVVDREFLLDHHEVVKKVIEAYARTSYDKRRDMESVVLEDAKFLSSPITEQEAKGLTQGILWKNTLENYAHFGLSQVNHDLDNLEEMLDKIIEVLVKTNALPADPVKVPLNQLYYSRILEEMKREDFHPGREVNILSTGMASDEQIRGGQALRSLSDKEWSQLVPVGEMRVEPIRFGRGTARLNVAGRRELEALAKMLTSWPDYYLTVTGRVRPGGDETAALALASSRAEAAVEVLVDQGVARERIRATARVSDKDQTSSQSVSFFVGQLPY